LAVGADGVMIEVHPHPEQAFSDAEQTLNPEEFAKLMHKIKHFGEWQKNYQEENSLLELKNIQHA